MTTRLCSWIIFNMHNSKAKMVHNRMLNAGDVSIMSNKYVVVSHN